MIGALRRAFERFRGGGEDAVTVPPMDGALRPNRRLEDAPVALAIEAPDNLVASGRRVLFSSGARVLQYDLDAGTASEICGYDAGVAAMALSAQGALAVALADGRILLRGGPHDGKLVASVAGGKLVCPTALLFGSEDELIVAQGSAERPGSEWKRDLMERRSTGAVWRVDLRSDAATCLADRLSYPYGLALGQGGTVAVSESWRHRLLLIGPGSGPPAVVLEDLPGYPARLSPSGEGGYWLAVFAPRSQLIEFVQREPEFRRRMMADIDPAYWAAPSLQASQTFLEPLQGGAQKHLGMLKPWAPTRSYGLAVRLDPQFRPVESLHSRADGRRHGVTSCVEVDGRVLVASKGGDALVTVDRTRSPARPLAGA